MQIRIYLPPYINADIVDEHGYITLEKDTTLKDLFRLLKVPFPLGTVHLCRVNYEKASLNRKLKAGDTVSFFSLISGG